MTAFEAIVQAIEKFECPYAPDIYTGNAKRYFTYNYADQRATEFADEMRFVKGTFSLETQLFFRIILQR